MVHGFDKIKIRVFSRQFHEEVSIIGLEKSFAEIVELAHLVNLQTDQLQNDFPFLVNDPSFHRPSLDITRIPVEDSISKSRKTYGQVSVV